MSHTIESDDHYVEGESVRWEFTVTRDGSAYDLTNGSVEWYLLPNRGAPATDAVLDGSSSGVSVSIVDAAAGRVDVVIDRGVTDGLADVYYQRLVVDDSQDGRQIYRGPFPISQA